MRDQCNAADGLLTRTVQGDVDTACRAGNADDLGMGVHAVRGQPSIIRRATGLPSRRCDSTISSMSAVSTKVYQMASG